MLSLRSVRPMLDLARGVVQSLIGPLYLATDMAGELCALNLHGDEEMQRDIAHYHGDFSISAAPVDADVAHRLNNYFAGDVHAIDAIHCRPCGTGFEQSVWKELRRIPAGSTTSYGHIARSIGSPGAARAVGRANGRNPIAIVVPCHRVVGSAGSLVGYGGGLERKRWLLSHESGELDLPL